MTTRILIIDEDVSLGEIVETALSAENCEVLTAASGAAALQVIGHAPVEVVLGNPAVAGVSGMELLPQIASRLPGVPIVLISDSDAQDLAGEAMSRGAFDYLAKPLQPSEVVLSVRRAREHIRLGAENRVIRRDVQRAVGERPIVATSEAMIELLELMERVAAHRSTVLLTGEHGTGKEILARAIHAQSPRRNRPFVAVSCGTTPAAQIESDLFGADAAGDPTPRRHGLYAEADEGTLFLDGVERMAPALQTRLLRVLQDEGTPSLGESKARPVDVRLIAATSSDLEADVAAGTFREDLFYRLNVICLDVPPLRERPRDIPLLFDHFLAHFRGILGKPDLGITDDALAHLCSYQWPGNVRELANAVERAVILAQGDRISLRELPDSLESPAAENRSQSFSLKAARKSFEADLIRRALRATDGNRTHAAKRLAISHRGLLYKIKEYGIRD